MSRYRYRYLHRSLYILMYAPSIHPSVRPSMYLYTYLSTSLFIYILIGMNKKPPRRIRSHFGSSCCRLEERYPNRSTLQESVPEQEHSSRRVFPTEEHSPGRDPGAFRVALQARSGGPPPGPRAWGLGSRRA